MIMKDNSTSQYLKNLFESNQTETSISLNQNMIEHVVGKHRSLNSTHTVYLYSNFVFQECQSSKI